MQVFDNLITNAAKYAKGSDVIISLIWYVDRAHIIVKDNGPGIPKEHLENIFRRFFRVSHDSGPDRGTGLGLYICREIVKSHRGEIYAESDGKGTMIHITLPKVQPTSDFEEVLP
jgi:two-component system OmpR family sensor kinase